MPKVVLMFRDKILNAFPIHPGAALRIGRHHDNDIVIENLAVSGRHACLDHLDGQIRLTDLKSKNGTWLNGARVTQCAVQDQDTITIGKHLLRADWSDRLDITPWEGRINSGPPELSQTIVLEDSRPDEDTIIDPPDGLGPAGDCLVFLSGGKGECRLSRRITIGKNQDADIVIGGMWSLLVGAPAAVIIRLSGDYVLRCAGGWIKPRRNGKTVRGTVKLNQKDIINVGPVRVQVWLNEN